MYIGRLLGIQILKLVVYVGCLCYYWAYVGTSTNIYIYINRYYYTYTQRQMYIYTYIHIHINHPKQIASPSLSEMIYVHLFSDVSHSQDVTGK